MTKRLFIFAGYDQDGLIDGTLLYYLRELSKFGDVILTMDNDACEDELKKANNIPNVLYASAVRHNEYDFGSYKRGFIWAKEQDILKNYDRIYLANDSVYLVGSLDDMIPKLDELKTDMTGVFKMIYPLHIQSFFVGLTPKIFNSDWFYEFLLNVKHEVHKLDIVNKYEIGLSRVVREHGFEISALVESKYLLFYDSPIEVIEKDNIPLLKKTIFSIGRKRWSRIKAYFVLRKVPEFIRRTIKINALRCKNALSPKYKYQRYAEVKHINMFISIVKKRFDKENLWVLLFGRLQIGKIRDGRLYLLSKIKMGTIKNA